MSNSEANNGRVDDKHVAIVGMSGRFPGAKNVDEFWLNLREGTEALSFFSDEELLALGIPPEVIENPRYVKARGVIEGIELFDADFFDFNRREAEIMDPQHRLFLECAWEALESAGCNPESYDGLIGVYAGVGMNTYAWSNLSSNSDLMMSMGGFRVAISNDKDFLPTQVSYRFDLKGPSVAVQTACSSSLVAVHQACLALENYDCDVALAGGVRLTVPQAGYWYEEGGIPSPDGHCRAFDEQARGTVSGGGLGIVVLKRLPDAVADGDPIRAVILGSAINNDGSVKIGYTAPSEQGQAEVIVTAQAVAGVSPEEISYVEAHGTGTTLGDPIEVAALTEAFRARTEATGYCALGAVKASIGHLDAAAGVAGLIKTVLALEHRQIPPSVNFTRPNPRIDFANSPFFVNTKLTDWKTNGVPRRAGVSSFGIGGTNAHVVVEEAPAVTEPGASRPWQLLSLSARTAASLERMTTRFVEHLENHPELSLPDVAFTLKAGRKTFEHRRYVIGRDLGESISILGSRAPHQVVTGREERRDRPVVFLFPGQGSQYLHMAGGLYRSESGFREMIDRCSEQLEPSLGLELRDLIYPSAERAAEAEIELGRTRFTQPALFAVEYALARLWMDWGVSPEAMIGHSVGEYVAACLAEVLSLEDALTLVAARGRLMEELPGGAMLSLELSRDEVEDLLDDELSLAAVNSPSRTVVSGSSEATAKLARRLAGRGVAVRELKTSHAFHSAMMDPALEAFAAEVSRVTLSAPRRRYISNLTGTWISEREATDPDYWVSHLRRTVLFSPGIEELAESPEAVFLEVGPGRQLSTFVGQHPGAARTAVSSLRHPRESRPDLAFLLDALGKLWLAGVSVDWAGFYAHEERRRVVLPSYPFERQRYWVEPSRQTDSVALADGAGQTSSGEEPPDVVAGAVGQEGAGGAAASQRTDLEHRIAQIWQEQLGAERVEAADNFFELGGDSLLATRVMTRISDIFGVEVPISNLFDGPTVAALAERVEKIQLGRREEGQGLDLPPIVPDPESRYEPFPLTDVQQAYWIGRSQGFDLGDVGTHIYRELEFEGLDLERFQNALRKVIGRHDMLRAIVLPDGRQQILEEVPSYEIPVLDLGDEDEEGVAAQLAAVRGEMSHQVLPSDRWPIFEFRATRLGEGHYRLHTSFDFLIGDAWSNWIFRNEIIALYRDLDTPLTPLEVSFRDCVQAEVALQDSPLYQVGLEYWRRRLDTLAPAPQLPTVANRDGSVKPRFERQASRLEAEDWARLKNRASQAGLTPSGVLLTAFSETLAAWSKGPRLTLNLTLFHRLPLHPQIGQLMGDFTSLVLLEADCATPGSFEDRARRLQERLWQDLDHRYVSGIRVLRELARKDGGFQRAFMPVVFTSHLGVVAHALGAEAAANRRRSEFDLDGREVYGIGQTPQVWLDHQVSEDSGVLGFYWDAVEGLFPEGMLQDMFDAYCRFLNRLANDQDVWREETRQLLPSRHLEKLAAVCATETPFPETWLHTPFAEQAAGQPDRPAVLSLRGDLSYGELRRHAAALAARLRELEVRPGTLVAVAMEKGWEQVAAVLGILEAGAAYLPVDPELPPERFRYLLEHGQAQVALTQSWLEERLDWPESIVRLRADEEPAAQELLELALVQQREDLAYVIFTSGSTGLPKGVMIDHRAAANTLHDVNQRFAVGPDDRVLALSSLSFDLSVYDIFGLLAAGGAVVLPEPTAAREPERWLELMEQHGVTIWDSVPALMEMLVDYLEVNSKRLPENLRLVMMSGDWIPVTLPDRIRALASEGIEIISMGGATEASIWSILYPIGEVDPSWPSIPYGRPMANQRFYVLDGELEPRPTWVPGELYIAGVGLAQGYWRDEERTLASFLTHPRDGERLYRTGDLGRYLPDGTIEFLGREDFQVKVQGHRIELGEIEAGLGQHPGVRTSVVVAVGERHGHKRLIAYVVPDHKEDGGADEPLTESELIGFLRQKLPRYMVPSTFVLLDELPLTANGKVDRNRLPAPETVRRRGEGGGGVAPTTALENTLIEVWKSVLEVDELGIEDNFFDLGGNSLLMVHVQGKLHEKIGQRLTVAEMFEHPTVRSLAEHLSLEQDEQPILEASQERTDARRQSIRDRAALRQRRAKPRSPSHEPV